MIYPPYLKMCRLAISCLRTHDVADMQLKTGMHLLSISHLRTSVDFAVASQPDVKMHTEVVTSVPEHLPWRCIISRAQRSAESSML